MPNGKKVLIVEDDKFLSLVLKSKLERDGFLVSEAVDGEIGLAKARSEKPDLILLDLILPKMSGFEFLEVAKTDPELTKIPVVVASNLGQDTDIQKAKGLGVLDYYVKATTPVEEIAAMVNKSLGLPENPEPQPKIEQVQPMEPQVPLQPEIQPIAQELAQAPQIPENQNPPVEPIQPQ